MAHGMKPWNLISWERSTKPAFLLVWHSELDKYFPPFSLLKINSCSLILILYFLAFLKLACCLFHFFFTNNAQIFIYSPWRQAISAAEFRLVREGEIKPFCHSKVIIENGNPFLYLTWAQCGFCFIHKWKAAIKPFLYSSDKGEETNAKTILKQKDKTPL